MSVRAPNTKQRSESRDAGVAWEEGVGEERDRGVEGIKHEKEEARIEDERRRVEEEGDGRRRGEVKGTREKEGKNRREGKREKRETEDRRRKGRDSARHARRRIDTRYR